jgi:plasmid maintenance system antidote protein VapI
MTLESTHLDGLMSVLRLENNELAAKIGTSRQTVWKLRHGHTRILAHWAKRIAPHVGASWQELVDGASAADRARTSSAEHQVLEAFRSTDDQGREMILRLVRSLRSEPTQREAAE